MTQKKIQLIFLILISGLFFVNTVNVQARQSQKIFTTVSTGTKVIASEFSPQIKKEAVSAALKSSVERAVAEVLTSEVFASNLETLYGNVLANPSKYILNYSVIAELKEDTKYVAAVKVRIDLTLLKKYLKRYGVIKSNREKPTLLLLISEQSEQDVIPKYWWGENSLPHEYLVSNEIIKLMVDEEFVFVGGDTEKIDLKKYRIIFNSLSDN